MAEGKGSAGGTAQAAAPPPSPKIVLKSIDMSEKMRNDAIDCARAAFEKHKVEKEIAEYIKKEFDRKYGQTWHCIVGRDFANQRDIYRGVMGANELLPPPSLYLTQRSYVTHETNHFLYFYVDKKAVLLFKSG